MRPFELHLAPKGALPAQPAGLERARQAKARVRKRIMVHAMRLVGDPEPKQLKYWGCAIDHDPGNSCISSERVKVNSKSRSTYLHIQPAWLQPPRHIVREAS